jgi:ABC-type Fe3+-hydroxamate transport system substrate-binding protein
MIRAARAATSSITDAIGRTVTLKDPAERIVLCFNYEEFTAVAGPAGWDRVVGFSKALWADWRPSVFKRYSVPIPRLGTLPDVGNTDDNSFSLEKVVSLRPDLVIMAEWSFKSLGQQVQQLDALGIPVLVIDYNAEIPERHVASTIAMGVATGNEERARTLASLYMDKLADIARRTRDVAKKPKVYVELGQGGSAVVGNTYWKGMWGRLLDMAGAENIAANRIPGAYAPLSPEYVLAADPDAIFIAGSSWAGCQSARKKDPLSASKRGSGADLVQGFAWNHAAPSRRARSRSRFARPYIWRFTSFSLVFCPSVWPFDHGCVRAACTPARS